MGTNGTMMSGPLYIPKGVTAENPAPGIVAIHGYINSRETQSGFAIEYARRGYVVLASDQTGHGYSDPPAFANGFGGIDSAAWFIPMDGSRPSPLPHNARLKWVGWDFVENNDVNSLRDILALKFRRLQAGAACGS